MTSGRLVPATGAAVARRERTPPQPPNFGLDGLKDLPDELRGKLAVFLAFVHTVSRWVMNRDAIYIALQDAGDICRAAGVPEEHVRAAISAYWEHNGRVRKQNPLHTAYSDE